MPHAFDAWFSQEKTALKLMACLYLQAALLDSLFGTERGLSANSELRAEINELITQLEAGTPNAAPNEVSLEHPYPALLSCSHGLLIVSSMSTP